MQISMRKTDSTFSSSPRAATTWTIDPAHSVLEFAVKHMMVTTAKGRFAAFGGTIAFDPADPADVAGASVAVTIDPASITTGTADRDAHLRNADFFAVEQYPQVTFRSTRVTGTAAAFVIAGELTIKGVTRPVTLQASFQGTGVNPWGVEVAGFAATAKFNRSAFGLTWNHALERGGVLVSDEVTLSIDIQAARAS